MSKCGWCGEDTLKIYRLAVNIYLCPKCAEEHHDILVEKTTNQIQDMHNHLKDKSYQLLTLKQESCKHENLIDTGYGIGITQNGFTSIFRCPDCNKEIHKRF